MELTKQEAIRILKVTQLSWEEEVPLYEIEDFNKALDMAIESLKQEPRIIRCAECIHYQQNTENTGFCTQLIRGNKVLVASMNWCCFAEDLDGEADSFQKEV